MSIRETARRAGVIMTIFTVAFLLFGTALATVPSFVPPNASLSVPAHEPTSAKTRLRREKAITLRRLPVEQSPFFSRMAGKVAILLSALLPALLPVLCLSVTRRLRSVVTLHRCNGEYNRYAQIPRSMPYRCQAMTQIRPALIAALPSRQDRGMQ